ncbi:venom protease-like isoform X2 [Penaeus chinensis]|nr:venom protease-like isoform X2 [Penaeus chinensis]
MARFHEAALALLLASSLAASPPHTESPPSDNGGDRGPGTAIGDQCQPKGGGQGECRELFSCHSVVRNIRRATPNICSFRGHAPIVCCPKATATREEPGRNSTSIAPGMSAPKLDFGCGRRTKQKHPLADDVVGGVESMPNSWPWMAILGRLEARGRVTWFCDGVLISPSFVLSAAHCAANSPVDVVRVGAHDLRQRGAAQEDLPVEKVILHPDYAFPSSSHDLVLLRLFRPVTLGPHVTPACLPWTAQDAPDLSGRRLILAGWGAMEFDGEMSNVLREVTVEVFPASKCASAYESVAHYARRFPDGINEDFLCAGDVRGGKDACHGDSGAPAMYNHFGVYMAAGVVSAGYGCGLADFPGLYTAIRPRLEWIRETAFSDYP